MRAPVLTLMALLLCTIWMTGCDKHSMRPEEALGKPLCQPATDQLIATPTTELAPSTKGFALELCQKGPSSWRRITDRRNGKFLDLFQPPQRVLSQSLGSDEMLLALLPEQERHRLIAVSALALSPRYSDVIEEAKRVEHVITDKTEEILALAPDLVLAASYTTPETLQQLNNARVPTIVLHQFAGIDDTIANLRTLAFALFLDDEGLRMVKDLSAKLDRAIALLGPLVHQQGEDQPIRVLAYGSGSVYAKGTTFDDLANRLGLLNLPAAEGLTGWPRADQEQLLAWKPQLVFLSAPEGSEDRSAKFFRDDFAELFHSDPKNSSPANLRAPTVLVLPSRLFSTVSQRLGDLAVEIAMQIQSTQQ